MRAIVLGVLCLVLLAGIAPAQPKDGDLVIGQFRDPTASSSTYGPGSIFSLDPATGKIFTIAARFTIAGTLAMGPNWIEMASDNLNFMVASIPSGATPAALGNSIWLHSVDTRGNILKTLVSDTTTPATSGDYCNAIDLDYDGTWILAGGSSLWAFNENTFTYSTLWTLTSPAGTHNAFVIDRAPGGPEYVLGKFNLATSANPSLMGVDRSGHVSTISVGGPSYVTGVKVDRITGDYVSSGFGIAGTGSGGEFMRTTKKGVLTTLNFPSTATTMYRANAIYVDKKRLAYILTYDWQTQPVPTLADNYVCSVYQMDLQGVFITQRVYSTTLVRRIFAAAGITEYGCRHVVCNGSGKPGTTVNVRFSSRKSTDAGRPYQLAASFGYTNGVRMPNGEYLDLFFDNLFLLTAQNLLPGVFRNFAGLLDQNGAVSASVVIPKSLPPNLGLAIFVSGLVIDSRVPGGVSTVGNTHWFVLN